MKKLCMTDLLGSKQIQRSNGVRREEILIFLEKLVEKAKKRESVELGNELMKLTNNVICRMIMSTRCSKEDDEAEKCRKLVMGSMDLAGKMGLVTTLGPFKKLGVWWYRKELEEIMREFHKLFDKVIEEHEERRGNDENKDLMDILLEVYHDSNAEFKISKTQIKAFLLDLFVAGTDSSGITMEWVMTELINHPNVMNKLKKEIESTVGTKRLVEESDIPNLHYLQAVVKETLRLHPVLATNFRECAKDCKIREYDIAKGTVVLINTYSIMRDPRVWDCPDEFKPERFMQERDNTTRHNMNFVAFGGGRRMCPGNDFALCIISITIACMVQCFDWEVDEKINMDERVGIIVAKACPLLCFPILHFNPFVTK